MRYHDASDEAAFFYLHREHWEVSVIARFTVEGEPTSKARARFTGYGSKVRTYTPAATRDCAGRAKRKLPDTEFVEKTCAQCGATYRNRKPSEYCSIECTSAARRVELACDHCGASFTKQRSHVRATNYCSPSCRDTAASARRTERARGTCVSCAGPVSKKKYKRCRACQIKGSNVRGKVVLS